VIVQAKFGEDLNYAVILPNQCIATSCVLGTSESDSLLSVSQRIWSLWNSAHGSSIGDGLPEIVAPRARFRDGSVIYFCLTI